MRKSIFDIVAENINMESETNRLVAMSSEEYVLVVDYYDNKTLFDYINIVLEDGGHVGTLLMSMTFLKRWNLMT